MKEMDGVGQRKGQVIGDFLQDALSQRITVIDGRTQVTRFAALRRLGPDGTRQ
jgi:hypothetical protein